MVYILNICCQHIKRARFKMMDKNCKALSFLAHSSGFSVSVVAEWADYKNGAFGTVKGTLHLCMLIGNSQSKDPLLSSSRR